MNEEAQGLKIRVEEPEPRREACVGAEGGKNSGRIFSDLFSSEKTNNSPAILTKCRS